MNFPMIRGLVLAAAMFGLAIVPAAAEGNDDDRLDEAWKAALMDLEGVLTPEQHAMINSIAYHAAASRLCDGVDLDVDKVGKALNDIIASGSAKLDDEAELQRMSNILLTLGTAKGIFLAEGALQKDEFCASAVASKADPENQHFWK